MYISITASLSIEMTTYTLCATDAIRPTTFHTFELAAAFRGVDSSGHRVAAGEGISIDELRKETLLTSEASFPSADADGSGANAGT